MFKSLKKIQILRKKETIGIEGIFLKNVKIQFVLGVRLCENEPHISHIRHTCNQEMNKQMLMRSGH